MGHRRISMATGSWRSVRRLFPMYVAAASDYAQPIFAYGTPRLARLGVELLF